MKMNGPYRRKDGRYHMVVTNDDGTKTTKSWPRVLMEEHLGRPLEEWEHVDHINEDCTDNRIENLQILTREKNSSKSGRFRYPNGRAIYEFICPYCGEYAQKFLNQVKHNRNLGKPGPYCSRSCAGKANYVNPYATGKVFKPGRPKKEAMTESISPPWPECCDEAENWPGPECIKCGNHCKPRHLWEKPIPTRPLTPTTTQPLPRKSNGKNRKDPT